MTDTPTQARAKQGMKNMLHAFAKSDHHAGALSNALSQFGFKSAEDVTDEKLFDVCEVARGLAGMPTGFMFANAKAEALGTKGKPETIASQINAMAVAYYATDEVEIVAHRPLADAYNKLGR